MIVINKEKAAGIPLLHAAPQDKWKQELPLVIFIHGFESAKEHNLHYAYLLAEKGFRVILPDVKYHGDREEGLTKIQLVKKFWDIVTETIKEIGLIADELTEEKLASKERIGIAGTSLGGIVANGAMNAYDWMKCGVSLMGNPFYTEYAQLQVETIRKNYPDINISEEEIAEMLAVIEPYDLGKTPERMAGRPMFYWHGKKDPIVPASFAYKFYQSVLPAYKGNQADIKFILDPHAGHKVSREGLLETAAWFESHMLGQSNQIT